MKRNILLLIGLLVIQLFNPTTGFSQELTELRIDPLILVSLKECRNITQAVGDKLYPEWDFQKIPVLFYRPNIQDLLINYPHKPEGFSVYQGFNPFGTGETIYVRNDTTLFPFDGQNTSVEIEGISVLVVADSYSRMRSQINGTIFSYPKDFVDSWLQEWNFIESPYMEICLILHEAFHVYQDKIAPEKYANEAIVSKYPLLDPTNNSLFVLEGNILKDAIFSKDSSEKMKKIKEFVAVRTFRQSRLKKEMAEYENLNEYVEGTAKYVEYKFLKIGESVQPIDEMYFKNGFNGYKGILSKKFESDINDMVNIVSVSDNRFGNRYGAGPMRWRLYELGACQALLLDDIMPSWKAKIFLDSMYLSDLIAESLNMSTSDREKYLQLAKNEYSYDQVFQEKLVFEQEGKQKITEQLDAILKTNKTLVTISYKGYIDPIGMGYTPFGVTQVSENMAIYDLVPITIIFKKGVEFQMKKVIPVIIDEEKKQIVFAADSPISKFSANAVNQFDIDEFTIRNVKMVIEENDNHIFIQLQE